MSRSHGTPFLEILRKLLDTLKDVLIIFGPGTPLSFLLPGPRFSTLGEHLATTQPSFPYVDVSFGWDQCSNIVVIERKYFGFRSHVVNNFDVISTLLHWNNRH